MTTGQIYWGAVPFVLIQILMVGLIIAFPTLVSSGLGKEPTVDVDKAFQQMQMAPRENADTSRSTSVPAASGARAPAAGASMPTPTPSSDDADKASDDDAMKRLLESAQKDTPKKP